MRLDLLKDAMLHLKQTEGAAETLKKDLNEANLEELLEELENLRIVMDALDLDAALYDNDDDGWYTV